MFGHVFELSESWQPLVRRRQPEKAVPCTCTQKKQQKQKQKQNQKQQLKQKQNKNYNNKENTQ